MYFAGRPIYKSTPWMQRSREKQKGVEQAFGGSVRDDTCENGTSSEWWTVTEAEAKEGEEEWDDWLLESPWIIFT